MSIKPGDFPKDPKPVLAVLSIPSFLRLWIGQVCSQLSINMMLFLIALTLYERTRSNAAVSGLFLAYGLPSLMFGMAAGAIVDRVDRRLILVASHLLRAGIILLLYVFSYHLAVVYILVFLNAVITQLTTPSEAPLIPQFVPKDLLMSANSLFSFTFYAAMSSGFILSGPVLRLFGRGWAHALLAGLFLIAAYSVYGLPGREGGIRTLTRFAGYSMMYILRRIISDLGNGIRYVSSSPVLRDSLMLLTMTQITLVLLGTLGPGFADRLLRIDIRDASVYVVGPVIAGILAGVIWIGNVGYAYAPKWLVRVGVLAAGVALMAVSGVVALANTEWFIRVPRQLVHAVSFGLLFLLGVANSFLDVPSNSMLQREAQGDMRGRVYGMLSAAVGGAGILPVVVSGVLADMIGVGAVIFLLGFVIAGYGIYLVRYYTISKA